MSRRTGRPARRLRPRQALALRLPAAPQPVVAREPVVALPAGLQPVARGPVVAREPVPAVRAPGTRQPGRLAAGRPAAGTAGRTSMAAGLRSMAAGRSYTAADSRPEHPVPAPAARQPAGRLTGRRSPVRRRPPGRPASAAAGLSWPSWAAGSAAAMLTVAESAPGPAAAASLPAAPSPPAGASSSIRASSAPTATVSSSATVIPRRMPDTGDGISVSTLSVETSSSGSSASTRSPSFFSQRVTVPSVTLSPSCGMDTETDMAFRDSFAVQRSRLCVAIGRCPPGRAGTRLCVHVQGLAGQREVRLAERLRLGWMGVDELGDV